jgi:molybdopterin-containing oxidoreductase family membrane subunit
MALASKLNLVIPALAQEELEGLTHAYTGPGLTYTYFPTTMEWLVWLFTLGLGALVVLIGYYVFALSNRAEERN